MRQSVEYVSILIGADNYWELVTGEIIRHENSPTAINTQPGWVLSGPIEELTTSVNMYQLMS